MHTTSQLEIYKASAGSGKTFSLTLNYLVLVLQNPFAYKNVLAVTFTNKATAEMKERILHVLQGLALNDNKVKDYRTKLLELLDGFDEGMIQQRAQQVYVSILHDYSRFSVNTIDAFVQRIIRSFAWELGIDGGFKLQLSADPVKEDLTERMYKKLDEDKGLQQWVIDMARERLEEGKRWDFREDMLNLANELFKEKFSGFEQVFRDKTNDEVNELFNQLNQQLNGTLRAIENKWKAGGEQCVQYFQSNGLHPDDFSHSGSGFISLFFNAAKEGLVEPGPRAYAMAADPDKLVTKKAPASTKNKVAPHGAQICSFLQQLIDWFESDIKPYETATAIRQNIRVLRLMRVFAGELAAYRKDNNALLISDTHQLLRELTSDSTASFIYEKTGSRYQHFLLDEFQDTSCFQWDNFKPLLTEALGSGNYNLLVGDVKQAIYRWRNGDWRLLLYKVQEQFASFKPSVKSLQENYRSAKPIIHFNNLLFHVAPQLLQIELNAIINNTRDETREQLEKKGYNTIFNQAYADSFQLIPASAEENGTVRIRFIKDKDENGEVIDYAEVVLQQLHAQVQALLEEGFAPSDIAVLTRTNKEARLVVESLVSAQQQAAHRFNIISGDALMLASNQAIQIIICALRWLNDSRHTLALAQLRQLVLLQSGMDANRLEVFASNCKLDILPPRFVNETNELRTLPLNELLHQLVMMFGLDEMPKHRAYLLAFYDLLQRWTRYGDASLQEFLQYWDDEGCDTSLPASAGSNAIEVLTVHKSKGLAFAIVLMPFLDWNIAPKGNFNAPILWVDNSATSFNAIPVVPVKFKSSLNRSSFANAYVEEIVLAAMDNLNVLYVAFTRPRKRLYGWAPHKVVKSNSKDDSFSIGNIGEMIRSVAASDVVLPAGKYEETRSGFDETANEWVFGEVVPNAAGQLADAMPPLEEYVYTDWRGRLHVKFQPLAADPEQELVLPRKQGILLHEILCRMENPGQLEEVLNAVQREGWLDAQQKDKASQVLFDVLQLDALQPWASGKFKRLAEQNMVSEKRELRRPDLVLYNNTETIVYDFKFTTGEKDKAKHEKQVGEYTGMLQQMGFANVKGFVVYGFEKKAVAV